MNAQTVVNNKIKSVVEDQMKETMNKLDHLNVSDKMENQSAEGGQ